MTSPTATPRRIAIIGGGPAGLMAVEVAAAAGVAVDLFERKGSVGRKLLIAGKGGLNLTHSEPMSTFVQRYRERADAVGAWLQPFDAAALRDWALGLGIETFVGSSGRVFPSDLKAAPLLRRWVQRLKAAGVQFHVGHRWLGWSTEGALRFAGPEGELTCRSDATVLALGGASWPQLGSDGAWVPVLAATGAQVAPLQPANCGFDVGWSAHLADRHEGAPLKPVRIRWQDRDGQWHQRQGECVLTRNGLEGSLIYAIGADLRDRIAHEGSAAIQLDLVPGRTQEALTGALSQPRGRRSVGEWLRRASGLDAAKCALVFETLAREVFADPAALAAQIKALPIILRAPRPIAEAISSAGGVRLESLDTALMLHARPGVFCAGEMLDWEAPTGGYLLQASMASGRIAAKGAVEWLRTAERHPTAPDSWKT